MVLSATTWARARLCLLLCGLALGLAAGEAAAQRTEPVHGLQPASPQPAEDQLQEGLAVEYISVFVRHVDQAEAAGKGRPGEPLAMLDWNTGDGEVLTSGEDNGVAASITGFIHFPEAGTYDITMISNDGIRLLISGEKIIEDPDVHSDRQSLTVPLVIAEPGWYPLYLMYFERKGTSTLELYWRPPWAGEDEFEFVPAESLAHIKA